MVVRSSCRLKGKQVVSRSFLPANVRASISSSFCMHYPRGRVVIRCVRILAGLVIALWKVHKVCPATESVRGHLVLEFPLRELGLSLGWQYLR